MNPPDRVPDPEPPPLLNRGAWTFPRDTYRVILHVTKDADGRFSAVAAQLPGAGSDGDTLPEALANAEEAVHGVLLSYREAGRPFPWTDEPPLPFGAWRGCVLVSLALPADHEPPPLLSRCAWCPTDPDAPPLPPGVTVTHGICEEHARELLEESDR